MRVELLTVGDELLLGDTVNGNAAWLGRRLADHGVEVTRSVVVGDELDVIVAAVQAALGRADAVITTGGLGPTYDDVTRDALAAAAGVPLVRDPELEARLRERTARAGRELRPMALRMADVPKGAGVLANSAGSAPGLRVELPGGVVYALPGVPFEMRTIMDEAVLPELARIAGLPAVARRTLRTARLWESVVATRLAEVEAMDGVRLAYLPDPAEVKIRITVAGPDAARRLADVEARVRDLLGTAVYGAEEETLDRVVHRLLAERGATVAAAESLTGGLIGAELTAMPGSSATFAGGMVTYATEAKHRLLGVPAELLAAHGAVHPDVAAAMAAGVRDALGAAYGIAVTGVAGPEPQDGRPVGTVFVGVAGPGESRTVVSPKLSVPGPGPETRAVIRRMTVVHALELLRRVLLGLDAAEESEEAQADREDRD
ncbi:CinA family nicotinamide mononucleotide deamidase-related protein [Actinomadura sp. NAK00032]|uniref:CinA family nicotinamide mononucleotide deamidase-related protein n=1 Tax=Actinomadura sp. NAK00032 TaxID=2742128 RepID=UPI0015907AD0|nr:CinA family nicotinamide mononucleotide deamidase-related protein [Actinomadura sp. NAK00032]QKW34886.1 CinA family nicotinamide mononucleotide deamidase-related protein [Actinomadura sp. NAK00032]